MSRGNRLLPLEQDPVYLHASPETQALMRANWEAFMGAVAAGHYRPRKAPEGIQYDAAKHGPRNFAGSPRLGVPRERTWIDQ